MAIKGILLPESYAVVDNVSIQKKEKNFSFDFIVYSDVTKSRIITKNTYNINTSIVCDTSLSEYLSFQIYENIMQKLMLDNYENLKDEIAKELSNPSRSDTMIIRNFTMPENDGVYKVTLNTHNVIDGDVINSKDIYLYEKLPINNNRYYLNNEYYELTDKGFIKSSGVNTEHYFNNKILFELGNSGNALGIAYSLLKEIDTFYNEYENV